MEAIKNYFILALIIVIGVLFMTKGCGTSKLSENVLKPKIDTIKVEKWDTIYSTKTITKYLKIYSPVKEVPIRDTNGLYLCNSLNTYIDSLVDSNIRIINTQVVRGELSKAETKYTLYIPRIINHHILNTIVQTFRDTIYRPYCYSFYGGIRIGANSSTFSQISPYIAVKKNNIYLDYSYNIINSSHNIGLGFNLFNIK